MATAARLSLPFSILSLFLLLFLPIVPTSAEDLQVVSHPSKLQLPPGRPVEASPGARPRSVTICNRVRIRGLSRVRDPTKFAHSLRVRVSVSQGDALFRIQTIELCLHRNESIGVGMCAADRWEKLAKNSWVKSVSPYGDRILDIRMLPDPSRTVEVSTEQEFVLHRAVFLVVGLVMMVMARILSESVVFYYGSAMTIGVLLVILMVLFQGMRLLPTGRRSSLAIFMYSSIVGVATFLLRYLSELLRSALVEIGVSEDMHNPLGIFLLVCLVLVGAWFGYWGVRKLVLTEEGSVDSSVAYFVEWATSIFAAVMILQSSLDTLLSVGMLGVSIVITIITRSQQQLRILRGLFKICRQIQSSLAEFFHADNSCMFPNLGSKLPKRRDKHSELASRNFPIQGLTNTPQQIPFEGDGFYSTFHKTPERKRFSKEGWETFTKAHTRKALRELVSSPEFKEWAVDNAERISVTPPHVAQNEKKHRLFRWF